MTKICNLDNRTRDTRFVSRYADMRLSVYRMNLYFAILGVVLFAPGCSDDSSSGSTDNDVPVLCGKHEVVSGDDCVCDNRADYYGTAGNCILCKGTHKVWKENACVCDDGFEDDKNGGCKLKCAENEIENNGACVCNNDAGYYGASGNCMLCAGEHRVIRNNTCRCDGHGFVEMSGNCVPAEYCDANVFNFDKDNNRCTCKDEDAFIFNHACVSIGDAVMFGKYPQSNEDSAKNDLMWRVLDIDRTHRRALLLTDFIVDNRSYHTDAVPGGEHEDVSWKDCTLRSWLNGYDGSENKRGIDYREDNFFVTAAFSEAEMNSILLSEIDNPADPESELKDAPSTNDRIFVLSLDEAKRYFPGNIARIGCPTDYAGQNDSNVDKDLAEFCSYPGLRWYPTSWWLRTSGIDARSADIVASRGTIGFESVERPNGVRPAVWVKY